MIFKISHYQDSNNCQESQIWKVNIFSLLPASLVAIWSSKSLTTSACCSQSTSWVQVTECNAGLIFAEVTGMGLVLSLIFVTDCKAHALSPPNSTTHIWKKACWEEDMKQEKCSSRQDLIKRLPCISDELHHGQSSLFASSRLFLIFFLFVYSMSLSLHLFLPELRPLSP